MKAHKLLGFSPAAAATPPSILLQTHHGAMISLFPSGRFQPYPHFLWSPLVSVNPGRGFVLTATDSFRYSQASRAPLLFWPTRKSPRQDTPPPRHRQQQHGDWRRTRKQLPLTTVTGNERSSNGERRKIPRIKTSVFLYIYTQFDDLISKTDNSNDGKKEINTSTFWSLYFKKQQFIE